MRYIETYKPALLWEAIEDQKVHCFLCNWHCRIGQGKLGHCRVRKNLDGKLYSLNYDKVCAASADPVEKKPLFHFQPGSKTFSISAVGCNFQCEFCQNWQISQMVLESSSLEGEAVDPQWVVDSAIKTGCSSVAYTYTEPTIFMELCSDVGTLARQRGLKNIFVSNGYMTIEAIDLAADWLDAVNLDLKAYSDSYYKKLCKARLEPVLNSIKHIAKNTAIWMEITTLLIPGENDSDEELKALTDFLANSIGQDVPWHISRFFPNYRYLDSMPTPSDTLERAYNIGKSAGLRHIYVGNLPGGLNEKTYCYSCGKLLIDRVGYQVKSISLDEFKCPHCQAIIAGVF